jgi:hypothetical protein
MNYPAYSELSPPLLGLPMRDIAAAIDEERVMTTALGMLDGHIHD